MHKKIVRPAEEQVKGQHLSWEIAEWEDAQRLYVRAASVNSRQIGRPFVTMNAAG